MVQEDYNSIEELMNWMGNYGPDYFRLLAITVMDDVFAEDYDKLSLQMEEDGNAATKLAQIQLFSGTRKEGDVIAMAASRWSNYVEILFVCYRSKRQIHEAVSYSRIKTYDLSDLTPQSYSTKTRRTTRRLQPRLQWTSQIIKMTLCKSFT